VTPWFVLVVQGLLLRMHFPAHPKRVAYFFSASASTSLQAGVSLSLDLARQAMIRPPPGVTSFAVFFVIAHAGVALRSGQLLCEAAWEVHSKAAIRMARSMVNSFSG
jgi:hypothetical protein